MKKLFFYVAIYAIATASYSQIEMNSSGNVGIGGSTPSSTHKLTTTKLYIPSGLGNYGYLNGINISKEETEEEALPSVWPNGNAYGNLGLSNKAFLDVYAYNFIDLSDKRKKENIRAVSGNLAKVLKLNVVKYDYKAEVFLDEVNPTQDRLNHVDKIRKNKIGLLAQDVREVIPEVVKHDEKRDIYGIDYTELIPVLIAALQEQQAEIDELKKGTKDKGKDNSTGLNSEETESKMEMENILYQNAPNPFDQSTRILFSLSHEVQRAQLIIYDLQGTQLKEYAIQERGLSSLTINRGEFDPGMYLYALLADGREIDSFKMILTKN